MSTELRNRLLLGPLIATVAIVCLLVDLGFGGHWGAVGLGGFVLLTAGSEYARLLRSIAPGIQFAPLLVVGVLLLLIAWPGPQSIGLDPAVPLAELALSLGMLWVAVYQMYRYGLEHFVANVGASVLALVYIGLAMHLLLALAALEPPGDPQRGTRLLLIAVTAIKVGDVSAYFGGRAFGKHKLAPQLSPGKTWEGFVASLIGSIGACYLAAEVLATGAAQPVFAGMWQAAVFGLVLGPIGVLGDLTESCLKRSAAVKDSGRSIPGFGGFLDVFDALLLAPPVAYVLALLL